MITWLVDRPNNVIAKQRYYQAQKQLHKPMWWRSPRAGLVLIPYYGLFTVTMLGTAYGVYDLVLGKPATADE